MIERIDGNRAVHVADHASTSMAFEVQPCIQMSGGLLALHRIWCSLMPENLRMNAPYVLTW